MSAPQVRAVMLTTEQLATILIALNSQLRREQEIEEILKGKKDHDVALRNLHCTKDALKAVQS